MLRHAIVYSTPLVLILVQLQMPLLLVVVKIVGVTVLYCIGLGAVRAAKSSRKSLVVLQKSLAASVDKL